MEAARATKQRRGDEAAVLSAFGARAEDAPAGSRSSAITAVFLQLLPRIAEILPRNVVACVLRLLCKAAAAALRGPQHATVHLSEPVPSAEFRWRWCGPQSLRSTTFEQRHELEKLTARSGVVANLEALEARRDLPLLSLPSTEWRPLLDAATSAGRLELCRWLVEQRGVSVSGYCLGAAAAGGHADVCEWLLDRGCEWYRDAPCNALRHGHVRLAERLLQLRPQGAAFTETNAVELVQAAARGCDLATLQRLHAEHVASRGVDLTGWRGEDCLGAAAGSPTPDWAAKVEWLEGLGLLRNESCTSSKAAHCKDAAARLAWLHARGYPVNAECIRVAAEAGNVEALRYVLAHGVELEPSERPHLVYWPCVKGALVVLQVLWVAGGRPDARAVEAAAEHGHLHVVSWAAEQLGEGAVLTADLFGAAAKSGSLPLLRWLHEHDCPWDAATMTAAVQGGCEEALAWLVERGCPMGRSGAAYVAAARHQDLPTLRCLARLGFPFAANGSTFVTTVSCFDGVRPFDPRPLQWLLDAGCPVDWGAALRVLSGRTAGLGAWLEAQRQRAR